MKDEIKVGDVLISKLTGSEHTIAYIGKGVLIYTNGVHDYLDSLNNNYTLKKPEPKLRKLVAFIPPNEVITSYDVVIDFEDSGFVSWAKKELIVKDGSLYVDMSGF